MSNPTSNFGWQMPTATDLVTDLPADFEVFGQAVDTSLADLKGGTTGQILAKNTNTDMDFVWITNDVGDITAVTAGTGISGGGTSGAVTITNDMATTITASGDIVVGTGSGTYDNLPIGTTGQILTADTTVSPYKVKWATPATPTSGLTLITSQSFSAVTSVSVNNCFTSTYSRYKVLVSFTSASAGVDVYAYWRVGGTNNTTGNYNSKTMYAESAGVWQSIWINSGSAGHWLMPSMQGNGGYMSLEISNPQQTNYTQAAITTTSDNRMVVGGWYFAATTSFDGFSLVGGGANLAGNIKVYGYQES